MPRPPPPPEETSHSLILWDTVGQQYLLLIKGVPVPLRGTSWESTKRIADELLYLQGVHS